MNIRNLFTVGHNVQIIIMPYANLQANLCVFFPSAPGYYSLIFLTS